MNNKETPSISVVVPIYKVEKYINECIDSILGQTYTDFELIMVDDGSPDRCGEICDEYAAKDDRIIVLHKENGGLADARNKGIEIARGKYITFIDSDDFIGKDYLEYLFNAAQKYQADIVEGAHGSLVSKMGTNLKDRNNNSYDVKVFDREQAISDYLMYRTMYANAWAKLYRRELFEDIRYPKGKLTEDEYTTYKVILKADKIVCVPRCIYFYRLREGSIVRSFSEKRFNVCREAPKLIEDDLKKAGLYNPNEVAYKSMRINLKIYNDFIQAGVYEEYKDSLDKIQRYIKSLKKDRKTWDSRYLKIYFLICHFPGLYRHIVFKHRKNLYMTDVVS